MKKLVTLSLGLALCASAGAENFRILSLGIGVPGFDEPQFMGLGISTNGRYVCGSIDMGEGYFIADIENDDIAYEYTDDPEGAELRHVDNNGLAIGYNGPGVTYSISGIETVLQTPGNYKYVLGESLTSDGSIMVGSLVATGYATYAAYSVNGEWQLLPLPEENDGESSAKYISGDGSVILGHMGSFGSPMLWIANDEGQYEIDSVMVNYITSPENEVANGGAGLYSLFPMGISENGKYAVCRGTILNDYGYYFVPVVYNVDDKTFTIYNEAQEIDEYGIGLTPSAIANDGTMIGVIGEPLTGSAGSFILKAGETQATTFSAVFPDYAEAMGFADAIGYTVPMSMTADGRYIVGYGYYCEDFYDEYAMAYFVTYIIDTEGETSGVKVVAADESDAQPESFYSLDGKRLGEMTKGLNIVRMSDGTVRKVINK